jgi:hypothetical protein
MQPSPKSLRSQVHPSMTLSPRQSSFASPPARLLSKLRRYLPGSRPSSRHHSIAATPRGFPPSLCSVIRLSQPLDGLFHHRACRLISSHSRVQGYARSGGSLSTQQLNLIDRALPPCRSARNCSPAETGCHTHEPRLRGFAPCEAAFLRFGVNLPAARAPHRVLSPPGAPFSRRCPSLPGAIRS